MVFIIWYDIRDRARTVLYAARISAAGEGWIESLYDFIESYTVCHLEKKLSAFSSIIFQCFVI